MRGKNKRGQVTIFVILAIIIVIFGVIIYLFYPTISQTGVTTQENPQTYIQQGVENVFLEDIDLVSIRGGSMDPEVYIDYDGDKVEYLCYTNQNYKHTQTQNCAVQRVFLIEHIENELKEAIRPRLESYFNSLVLDYREEGYEVNLEKKNFSVQLLPNRVIITSQNKLELTKDGATTTYNSFSVVVNNNLYELASLAEAIANWEREYPDTPLEISLLYPNFHFEKKKLDDGTKIFTIEDTRTKDKFRFAIRGVNLPAGSPEINKFINN